MIPPKRFYIFPPDWGMLRRSRRVLRREWGQGKIIFPVRLITSRIGILTGLIHTLVNNTTNTSVIKHALVPNGWVGGWVVWCVVGGGFCKVGWVVSVWVRSVGLSWAGFVELSSVGWVPESGVRGHHSMYIRDIYLH